MSGSCCGCPSRRCRCCYGLPRTIGLESGDKISLHLVPQFYEQRVQRGAETASLFRWELETDRVFQLETRSEKPCTVYWRFPGGRLVYDEAAGVLTVNGEKRLIPSGLTDFSLVLDRGIAEFSAGGDTFLTCLETPAGEWGGVCEVSAEEPLEQTIYTVE